MHLDEVKRRLQAAGLAIVSEKRLGNDLGMQLHIEGGGIVNVFDKGTLNIQGKNTEPIKTALNTEVVAAAAVPAIAAEILKKVFVVYGHDTTARGHVEAMLR